LKRTAFGSSQAAKDGGCDLSVFICRRNRIAAHKLKHKNKNKIAKAEKQAEKQAEFLRTNAEEIAAETSRMLQLEKLEAERRDQEERQRISRLKATAQAHVVGVKRAEDTARKFRMTSLSSTVATADFSALADSSGDIERAQAEALKSHRAYRWAYRQQRARSVSVSTAAGTEE
jgi:hypothetical protein